ncbi:MAG: MFS transporter [Porphyromonas sp.]|nr:MFS transporter [Porphyromonas sp.]
MSAKTNVLKGQLSVMSFLQYAVFGAWLSSLGVYLGHIGLGSHIGTFFATLGIASLFMPTIMGIVADRWIPVERLVSLSHLMAGIMMVLAAQQVEFGPLYTYILLSVCFYMPTLGLTNSAAYFALSREGLDTVQHFPPIRVFGTVGFIVAAVFVDQMGYKTQNAQLYVSAVLSFVLAVYMLTLPASKIIKQENKDKNWIDVLGLRAFSLFKDRNIALFFIFSFLLGISLQITNSFANHYITGHFGSIEEYANSWAVNNSGTLISISQVSEAVCILLIPFFLKRYGIKVVMLISMFAWVLRFGLLGTGNPLDGLWMLIASMIVYGVAFDFFNVSGSLYIDQQTPVAMRSSAQGIFLLMTNGLGSIAGPLLAQQVINRVGYPYSWHVFALYSLVIAIAFWLLFKYKYVRDKAA